jgi:hypothetical protein
LCSTGCRWTLAEQHVEVLLLAADISQDADTSAGYFLGRSPTELMPADAGTGIDAPLEDGMGWAALHQDAIVVVRPDRAGPLAGEPAAALLRRDQPHDRQ